MDSYLTKESKSNFLKPSILAVIGARVELRKRGREYFGLCPFHADKNPSFSVSEDKQLFHCFGCQQSGDVFDFIQALDNIGFKEALVALGLAGKGANPFDRPPKRQAADDFHGWAREQCQKIRLRLRELGEQLELADELQDTELAESIWRERQILGDLCDDLPRFEYRADFVEIKDAIENIIRSFE